MSTQQVRVTLTIDVDQDIWYETYGTRGTGPDTKDSIRERFIETDVCQYVQTYIQESAASDEDAILNVSAVTEDIKPVRWGSEVLVRATGQRGVVIDDIKKSGPSKGKFTVHLIGSVNAYGYYPEELTAL